MIYIFTHKITSRVKFAFNLVFRDLMQVDFQIITKRKEFELKEGVYEMISIG